MSNKNFLTEYENSNSLLMYQPKVEVFILTSLTTYKFII